MLISNLYKDENSQKILAMKKILIFMTCTLHFERASYHFFNKKKKNKPIFIWVDALTHCQWIKHNASFRTINFPSAWKSHGYLQFLTFLASSIRGIKIFYRFKEIFLISDAKKVWIRLTFMEVSILHEA